MLWRERCSMRTAVAAIVTNCRRRRRLRKLPRPSASCQRRCVCHLYERSQSTYVSSRKPSGKKRRNLRRALSARVGAVARATAVSRTKSGTLAMPECCKSCARDALLVLQQQLNKPGRAVPALAAARLEARIELVDKCRYRQRRATLARLVEADAHVLAHPLGGEAEAVGLELVHLLPAILHLPGLRCPLGDDRDDLLHIQIVALGERHRLSQAFGDADDADLVDH